MTTVDLAAHQRIADQYAITMAENEQIEIISTSREQIQVMSPSFHRHVSRSIQGDNITRMYPVLNRLLSWRTRVENAKESPDPYNHRFWRHVEYTRHIEHAMAGLDAVSDAAMEEGYPVPSKTLVANVRDLLLRVARVAPHPYSVYPMEEGQIAIHASNEPTGAVVITCLPHDIWCVVSIGRSRRRAWFQNMDELPDPFTRKALKDLYQGIERP